MATYNWQEGNTSLGLYFSFLAKRFFGSLMRNLAHIDLDRYFIVLIAVEESGETFTQQNLCDCFNINKASMVRIIDYLTKKGYLQRQVNKADRREHLLILTEKAKSNLPDIKLTVKKVEETALQGFSAAQKDRFLCLLNKVYVNMAEIPEGDLFVEIVKTKRKTRHTKKSKALANP
jgi:DNA-binding MarR family transcriptional regulator